MELNIEMKFMLSCFAFTNKIPKSVHELDLLAEMLFYKVPPEIKMLEK